MKCECCGHPELDHLDEGGLRIGCWSCHVERERIREQAWCADGRHSIKRWLHRVFDQHVWFDSSCMRCGIHHP